MLNYHSKTDESSVGLFTQADIVVSLLHFDISALFVPLKTKFQTKLMSKRLFIYDLLTAAGTNSTYVEEKYRNSMHYGDHPHHLLSHTETCTCRDNSIYMCELDYKVTSDADNNPNISLVT